MCTWFTRSKQPSIRPKFEFYMVVVTNWKIHKKCHHWENVFIKYLFNIYDFWSFICINLNFFSMKYCANLLIPSLKPSMVKKPLIVLLKVLSHLFYHRSHLSLTRSSRTVTWCSSSPTPHMSETSSCNPGYALKTTWDKSEGSETGRCFIAVLSLMLATLQSSTCSGNGRIDNQFVSPSEMAIGLTKGGK